MNSYEKINYKIRPQKCVERKLIVELINCISNKLNIEFNYIGLGSLFFADFVFFHKTTNIKSMKSIEDMRNKYDNTFDELKQTRFKNNIPYGFIELDSRKTCDVLPEVNYDENLFIWLDYDGNLEPYMLSDIEIIASGINKTSIFILTINSNIAPRYRDRYRYRNSINSIKLIEDFQPFTTKKLINTDFAPISYYDTVMNMIDLLINNKLYESNSNRQNKIFSCKISDIKYKDGVEIYSYIWMFHSEDDRKILEDDDFNSLKIVDNYIDLSMDILTNIERKTIEKNIEKDLNHLSCKLGLDQHIIKRYIEYYRYIPEYAEIFL